MAGRARRPIDQDATIDSTPDRLTAARRHRLDRRGCVLEIVLIGFDHAAFDPAAFGASGIDCPAPIARSVRKRQAEFFHGRLAARLALATLDPGAPPTAIGIGTAREPLWPAGRIGSITHSDTWAGAAVLRADQAAGLGIDIETVAADAELQALRDIAVAPVELDLLRAQAGATSMNVLLSLVFSAKESLYKGAYASVGRFFDFSAVRVSALDQGRQTLALTVLEDLSPAFHRNSVWHIDFDFLAPHTLLTSFIHYLPESQHAR